MQEITGPLICSECRVEFLPHEGGVCSRCDRLFCGEDLFIGKDDPSSRLCRACKPADTEMRSMLGKLQAASLRSRRRTKKTLS
jgi:hypothetical protein